MHLGHRAGAEQHLDVGAAEHRRDAEVADAELAERADRRHRLPLQLTAAARNEGAWRDGLREHLGEAARLASRGYDGSPGTGTHWSPSTS